MPLPWVFYVLKFFLPDLQWWWRPTIWDIELQDFWITHLLNQNTNPPQIIHNCIYLLLVSILSLVCCGEYIMKIIYLILFNITVTVQYLIILLVDVINVKLPHVPENIQGKIHTARILYIIIPTCTISILWSIFVRVITR